jgi:hypothetical protein
MPSRNRDFCLAPMRFRCWKYHSRATSFCVTRTLGKLPVLKSHQHHLQWTVPPIAGLESSQLRHFEKQNRQGEISPSLKHHDSARFSYKQLGGICLFACRDVGLSGTASVSILSRTEVVGSRPKCLVAGARYHIALYPAAVMSVKPSAVTGSAAAVVVFILVTHVVVDGLRSRALP